MKIVRYDQLHVAVLRELPAGATEGELNGALASAGRDFCERTLGWKETLTAINIVADTAAYTLNLEASANIQKLDEIYLRSAADVTAGRDGTKQNTSLYDFDPATNVLTFPTAPATSITGGLVVTVILVPSLGSREIADWFLNRYAKAITWGAVANLTGSKSRPALFDAVTFSRATVEFSKGIARAVRDAACGYKTGSINIRPKWSFIE